MSPLRSAAAIVAGFGFVNTAMWIGGGLISAVFHAAGFGGAAIAAIIGVSALAAIMGGWITARLAGRAEFQHALVLAGIMGIIPVLIVLGGLPEGQPAWYPLAVGAVGVAGVLAGGWLRASAAEATRESPSR
jgi:hypothetical protein